MEFWILGSPIGTVKPMLAEAISVLGGEHEQLDAMNGRSVIVKNRLVKSQTSFGGKGRLIDQELSDAVA